MNRWMWQATASVVRELVKSGHAKLAAVLFALALLCSTVAVAMVVLGSGHAAYTTIGLAKRQLEQNGGPSVVKANDDAPVQLNRVRRVELD